MRFLFVDRIVQLSPGQLVRGIKHVIRDDAYLTTDEQGRSCFIPSLIGETLGQLAAWNAMYYHEFTLRPVAGIVGSARLYRPAYLGETIILESHIDSLDERAVSYHSLALVGDEPIFSIEGALGPLLPMTDFIETEVVRSQFKAIYYPDEGFNPSAFIQNATTYIQSESGPKIAPMLFDRIISSTPGVSLVAEKRISEAAPYFRDHFPNKPVLPMTVLLECQLNLAKEFIRQAGFSTAYEVSELRKIKMNEFVSPGAVVVCYVKVKQQSEDELVLNYRSEVDGKRVCVMDLVCLAKRC